MLSAMLDAHSKDRTEVPRPPAGFVRRDIATGRHAGLEVRDQLLTITKPESAGYDPYDHVPPPTVDESGHSD